MTDNVKPSPLPSSRPTARQQSAMENVRTRGLQGMGEQVRAMLERLPTILFEVAKDLPEAEQQPYTAVLDAVKRKRADVEARFLAAMGATFARLQPELAAAGGKKAGVDFSTLRLVDTDAMDITVALDSMVTRARLKYGAALSLLRQRYAWLTGKPELTERDVPLDPLCVATAFSDALEALEVGVQERLIVLRIFQKRLLDELQDLLDEVNQIFVTAGVLPDLKAVKSEPAKKAPPAAAKKDDRKGDNKEEPAKPAQDTEQVFSFLQNLLGQGGAMAGEAEPATALPGMQYHGGRYVGGGGIGSLPAASVGGSVAAVPLMPQHIAPTATVQRVETPDLVSKLSHIQEAQPRTSLADDASSPSVEQVRSSIRDNLRSDDATVEAIKRADEDVINLISMLFDYVLGDKDLPAAIKALIGRLQVPLLKVAILDRSFFGNDRHPARRLLNTLARAGIGWSSRKPSGDVLYARIESVVLRILNEFVDDLGLFQQLLDEFNEFNSQQQKRVEAVDKRTRETEEGRARAELARAMVQQTLNRRLADKQLPLAAITLLQDAWRNVLYINCLKEGTESESWKQAVKVVDAVVWSVQPQPGPEWTTRLQSLAPKLLNSLKKGLASVSFDSLAAEKLLRELMLVHARLLRGEAVPAVGVMEARAAQARPASGQVAVAEVSRTDAAKVATVVLPETETPAVPDALPDDNEHVQRVHRLSVGSWVEFTEDERQVRHKLVARIRSVDKLIFADRRGVKSAEMAGMKLAVDMSLGRARVVEEVEFIDRALESMIGSLRDISSRSPAVQGASA